MDDNKMLTLASNERIPLTPSMRLLLEINHMKHCSPATVSRGGVIYVNADDIGWRPARPRLCLPPHRPLRVCCSHADKAGGGGAQAVDSWLAGLEASEFRPLLAVLFDRGGHHGALPAQLPRGRAAAGRVAGRDRLPDPGQPAAQGARRARPCMHRAARARAGHHT